MERYDLIILGGGCAGLSLGYELARHEHQVPSAPRVLILESRQTYSEDRTWCFWSPEDPGLGVAPRKRWSSWSFSHGTDSVVHQSKHWFYTCLSANDFYDSRARRINKSDTISLQMGVEILDFKEVSEGFQLRCNNNTVYSPFILDTRPPEKKRLQRSSLLQAFAGVEIELEAPAFNPGEALLMDNMTVDQHGFLFDYILPLSNSRLLFETTRFTKGRFFEETLSEDLEYRLEQRFCQTRYEVLRRESGCVPMGLPEAEPVTRSGWIAAGTRGGAVRASTGYAFLRIQNWARLCRQSLHRFGHPVAHPKDPLVQRHMDDLFLKVLKDYPKLSPSLFMNMASKVKADAFVRFMTGCPSWTDRASVIGSLPPRPFLKSLGMSFYNPRKAFTSKIRPV